MSDRWYLVGDIGGTNARFAFEDPAHPELQCVRSYSVAEHAAFSDAVETYLAEARAHGRVGLPEAACLGVASAVHRNPIRFTNSPWSLDRAELSRLLGTTVHLINDFAAVGYGVTELRAEDYFALGGGEAVAGMPIVVLGAGTGLGVCSLVVVDGRYHVIEGEGGHADFAPVDAQEIAVLQILTRRFGRVSTERLLSGSGIVNIYTAMAELAGRDAVHSEAADITGAALEGVDSLAVRSLELFCRVLGSTAGNLALTLGARGGVYIAGGIAPRFKGFLARSEFRARFEAKGRFSDYLRDIPVRLVTRDNIGLEGAFSKLRSLRDPA
ncbi:MAG: glucokinase [Halieaceae bacterium]|jgi:glucokinase|nr:glucokinase [Halieaceae bacterium]